MSRGGPRLTPATLPGVFSWLVTRLTPARHVAQMLDELGDDYAAVCASSGVLSARWWLASELVSLLLARAAGRLHSARNTGPIWLRDVHLVIRGLRRGPLPALGAALMLSTGLATVLLTGGLVRTLLFRHVSATHGEALRRVGSVDRQGRSTLRLSYPELQQIRDSLAGTGLVTAVNMQPVLARATGSDVQTMAEVVDGRYFSLTGTEMTVGRALLTSDDQPASAPVTVISEPFWRERFAASPSALGQIVQFNGHPFTIVGVARAIGSSSFLGASVDAWVSIAHADSLLNRGWRTNVSDRWFTSFVLPETSSAEVEARLAAADRDLARLYPDLWRERRLRTSPATVLAGSQRGSAAMLAAILVGLSVLILATAASNLGGVFLARAVAARRQVAIHLSIGSGRAAIVRRQLLEGALLGAVGAGIAIALYAWARILLAEIALLPTLALRLELPLDLALVAAILAIGIGAGMTLALAPALWAARVHLADAMREGDARTSGTRSVARLRGGLVSAQVGLSLILVVGAALFARSLAALAETELGFPRERLVAMDLDVEPSGAPMSAFPTLARAILERAAGAPGVSSVAMATRAPIDRSTPATDVRAGGQDGATISDVSFYSTTSGYFETVGVAIVAGRAFTAAETDAAAPMAIVNEALASRLWPGGDVLDRTLYLVSEQSSLRIVGIARDSKYRSLDETRRPHFYRPTAPGLGLTLLARASSDPRQALDEVQRALRAVDAGVVGFFPRTLDDHLAIELLPTRAAAGAASVLGTLALVLSGVGLYGLVAWFVELRRREIGVRMALGASVADVRRLVVRQAITTALPGLVIGTMVAAGLSVFARASLYGVGPVDPTAFAVGTAALSAVVALAAYVPSRRATQVDPATALRNG